MNFIVRKNYRQHMTYFQELKKNQAEHVVATKQKISERWIAFRIAKLKHRFNREI